MAENAIRRLPFEILILIFEEAMGATTVDKTIHTATVTPLQLLESAVDYNGPSQSVTQMVHLRIEFNELF